MLVLLRETVAIVPSLEHKNTSWKHYGGKAVCFHLKATTRNFHFLLTLVGKTMTHVKKKRVNFVLVGHRVVSFRFYVLRS